MTEIEMLTRQLADEKERADQAWKNTAAIDKARMEEMRKRDAAESDNARLRMLAKAALESMDASVTDSAACKALRDELMAR